MSDELRAGQSASVDALAELHAQAVNGESDTQLRQLTDNDPAASSVVASLDATVAQLRALPPLHMPAEVSARINAAIAQESAKRANLAPVIDIAEARQRRARRLGLGAGLGLVAAAAIAFLVLVPQSSGFSTGPIAEPGSTSTNGSSLPQSSAPLSLPSNQAVGPLAGQLIGAQDYGALNTPQKVADCLAANGVDPSTKPLGVRQVTINGQQGIFLILPTGKASHYQLLVVEPTCGPGHPGTISNTFTGN